MRGNCFILAVGEGGTAGGRERRGRKEKRSEERRAGGGRAYDREEEVFARRG